MVGRTCNGHVLGTVALEQGHVGTVLKWLDSVLVDHATAILSCQNLVNDHRELKVALGQTEALPQNFGESIKSKFWS